MVMNDIPLSELAMWIVSVEEGLRYKILGFGGRGIMVQNFRVWSRDLWVLIIGYALDC